MSGKKSNSRYVEKSSPGPKNKPGLTRYRILWEIYCNPNGVLEPDIRDVLKEEFGITDSKGIKKNHLGKLEEMGFIFKESVEGEANTWYPCKLGYKQFHDFWLSLDKKMRYNFFFTEFVQRYIETVLNNTFIPYMKFVATPVKNSSLFDKYQDKENWEIPSDLLTFVKKSFELSPTLFTSMFCEDPALSSFWNTIINVEYYSKKREIELIKSQLSNEEYTDKLNLSLSEVYLNIEKNTMLYCLSGLSIDWTYFYSIAIFDNSRESLSIDVLGDIHKIFNSEETVRLAEKYGGNGNMVKDLFEIRKMLPPQFMEIVLKESFEEIYSKIMDRV